VATNNLVSLSHLYSQKLGVHLGITHALGYILGDKLYNALVTGIVSKDKIRDLFCHSFEEDGIAFRTYLELVRDLWDVPHDHYSRADYI